MTEKQSKLFSEIVDLNWDFENSEDWKEKIELAGKLSEKKKELIEDMGQNAYDRFIATGREMFAPKKESIC
jgi:hypothetical protein